MNLPTLYKKTSTGKIQTWNIVATIGARGYEMHGARIITTYGLLGGKLQTAEEIISEGKNIGKTNETTMHEQAELEAKSQWEKKVKKGYVEKLEDAEQGKIDTNFITGGIEPMLAQSYDKHAAKISWPAYVQPKLDGHRCIAIIQDGVCTLWSRTRKPITGVPHIARQLETAFPNETIVLDGELYNHDYREKFEELTSFIRSATPKSGHEVVQFWIYDIVNSDIFALRASSLTRLQTHLNEHRELAQLVTVATDKVEDEEGMITTFGVYLQYGFEGLMLRNTDGVYKNKRSYDLQKVKIMADSEFEIIDITEGRGKMAGKAMFHVKTEDGKEFRVKMVGALDSLSHYLDHKDEYIGRELTVKFQNLSADGVPRFPIGMRIHESL